MSEYAWVIGLAAFALTFLGVYGGWAVGRYKGESAHALAKEAKDAADRAEKLATALATALAADLAAYKADVVAKFATIEMLQKSEDRFADAINRFADRLDRLIEQRPLAPTPRTRTVRQK